MTHKYFIRWLLLVTLISIGFYFAYYFGIIDILIAADNTYISWLIAILFVYFTVSSGITTYRQEKSNQNIGLHYIHNCKFVAEIVLVLGMVGTVIGFMMMLGAFVDIDVTNKTCMQAAIGQMGQGMKAALVTTLVGLVTHFLLRVQLHNFSKI